MTGSLPRRPLTRRTRGPTRTDSMVTDSVVTTTDLKARRARGGRPEGSGDRDASVGARGKSMDATSALSLLAQLSSLAISTSLATLADLLGLACRSARPKAPPAATAWLRRAAGTSRWASAKICFVLLRTRHARTPARLERRRPALCKAFSLFESGLSELSHSRRAGPQEPKEPQQQRLEGHVTRPHCCLSCLCRVRGGGATAAEADTVRYATGPSTSAGAESRSSIDASARALELQLVAALSEASVLSRYVLM